jgi:hypothetical protein
MFWLAQRPDDLPTVGDLAGPSDPVISGRGRPPPSRPRRWLRSVSSGPDKSALAVHACGMASVVKINDVLAVHVSLEAECVDRLYLNAYCPLLQVSGQVVRFPTGHLGHPVPSPALFQKIGNRFRREVDRFAASAGVPVLHLKSPAGPAGMTASWTTSARIWTGLPASSISGWWPSWSPRSSSG